MGCRARGDVLSRGRDGSRGDRGRGAHHGDVEGESREVHVAEILLGGLHVAEGGVAAHAAVQEFLASLEADVVHAERLLERLVSLHALARGVQRLALREERVGVGRRAEKRERRAATRRGDTRRAAGAPAREEDASANLTPETSRARELSRGGRHDARRGGGRPGARGRRDITRDGARDGDARDGEHPSTNAARRSARCGVTLTIVSRYLHRRSTLQITNLASPRLRSRSPRAATVPRCESTGFFSHQHPRWYRLALTRPPSTSRRPRLHLFVRRVPRSPLDVPHSCASRSKSSESPTPTACVLRRVESPREPVKLRHALHHHSQIRQQQRIVHLRVHVPSEGVRVRRR